MEGTLKVKVKKFEGNWKKLAGAKPDVEYFAGPGRSIFKFKGRTLWAQHSEGKVYLTGWDRRPQADESISIHAYGTDNTILKEFVDCAVIHSMKKDEGKIGIWEHKDWCGGMWHKA